MDNMEMFLENGSTKIVDAMKKISINATGIIFVVDNDKRLIGTVTDGDIRRWIIKTGSLSSEISNLMNTNPKYVFMSEKSQARELLSKYSIRVVPIVDEDMRVVEIYFEDAILQKISGEKMKALGDIPVIIMAGGKGTRLYPYTKILPKPLIPINDIPIVERIIKEFCKYGSEKIYMTLNYKKEMIKAYFRDLEADYDIHFVEEDRPLGTAGSISLIEDELPDTVIITNCDILIRADYADIVANHKNSGNALTVVSSFMKMTIPYGVIKSSSDGIIDEMEEKPSIPYFANTGMYVIDSKYLQEIPKDSYFDMTDLVDKLIKENKRVGMYPISEEAFLDMGEMVKMQQMEEKLKSNS